MTPLAPQASALNLSLRLPCLPSIAVTLPTIPAEIAPNCESNPFNSPNQDCAASATWFEGPSDSHELPVRDKGARWMIPPTPLILEQTSAICSSLFGFALKVCPDNSSCSVTDLAPNSKPILATESPFSLSRVANASATPQLSCVITMVPPIGNPSATAGQGSTSTCHLLVEDF